MTVQDMMPNGAATGEERPLSTVLADPGATFPPLHAVPAHPVAQLRWERLVSSVTAPYAVGRLWDALVDPAAVARWLAVCRGEWATTGRESMLDFEDGEFFYCVTDEVTAPEQARPGRLGYRWRWVGIGPATTVTWTLTPQDGGSTTVTVTETATNPPSDWRSWNGMGWPGILDQLVGHVRTGTSWRWPWRRMGPYVQVELAAPPFEAWTALTSDGALKHWLQRSFGSLTPGDPMTLTMGDASGTIVLDTQRVVDAGQQFPSYLPYIEFVFRRTAWERPLGGRLWIEPAGLGRSVLQVFLYDWEAVRLPDPVEERTIITNFWVGALCRAQALFAPAGVPAGPHGWST